MIELKQSPMSIARHHAEWLSLIAVSGPFLSLPVLVEKFPQGLDAHDPDHFHLLRQVFDEWDENQQGRRPDPAIHHRWIKWVLSNTLDLTEVLVEGQDIPQTLKSALPEHGETLRPDMVVMEPDGGKARLLIQRYPLKQGLSRVVEGRPWKTSPDTRMAQLLKDTGVRVGLVTNGGRWMLVDAPQDETTGYASWRSDLWLDEPITLQAFRTLLAGHRFFGVPDDDTLESLLSKSAEDQQEVTDQLGYQVRRAVEVLVQSLDKADRDHGGELIAHVEETRLYEAALTVMMRLVFLFCAEERELLLLGDELYDGNYAVSTLREQLRTAADEHGEEILERRNDAWSRLLTTFRAVYHGLEHDRLRLPAYGGNLFDPDRFPFLEGRQRDTSWKDTPSQPLPINNRTVLHLLEALQVLRVKLPGGGPAEPRKLSFRALGIEQIGHVYEGLLDHTAVRAVEPVLGLSGSRNHEPEIPLSELEELASRGEKELHAHLRKETGRSSVSPIKKLIEAKPDDQAVRRFRTTCQGDEELWRRVKPFAGLVRTDTFGYPIVILPGSVHVTAGTDRRTSGTHYTPRSLTEPIIQYALEPLVYEGPAEGKPKQEWRLKSPAELLSLNVCDMACGSGAFLVQACRYLSERLVEAWEAEEKKGEGKPRITPTGDVSTGVPGEQLIPVDVEERLVYARRLVAERCLYGVDVNPLAAEMAKLSLWLVTMARDRPFTFLDHAIKCGDSLLGVTDPRQIETFHLDPERGETLNYSFVHSSSAAVCKQAMERANEKRRALESFTVNTPQDLARKESLLREANAAVENLRLLGDLLIAAAFAAISDRKTQYDDLITEWVDLVFEGLDEGFPEESRRVRLAKLRHHALEHLNRGNPPDKPDRPFHWATEFPEVFSNGTRGFDAILGNPPFQGGQKITGALGTDYRDFLVTRLALGQRGSADLCSYFFLRAASLLRKGGTFGLLATNTIAQGDTREVGLEQLMDPEKFSCSIPRAVPSRKWPGAANLEVAHVWGRRGDWKGPFVLEEKCVKGITPFLSVPGKATGKPHRLKANEGKSFQGSIVLGMGFVLEPEEAQALIERNPKNKDVLFPYLNGEDLNSRPDQSPSRWVINFQNWPLDRSAEGSWLRTVTSDSKEAKKRIKAWLQSGRVPADYPDPVAADYPDCLRIVEEKVKPERAKINDKGGKKIWWRFLRPRPELYATIAGMERVLVVPLVSKFSIFAPEPRDFVYSHALGVIADNSCPMLCLVQSTVHGEWSRDCGSTLETRMRYTPSDCFETFPIPDGLLEGGPTAYPELESLGERYHEHRRRIMRERGEGLTKTYNCFHDPDESASDIVELRRLHVEMDRAVAAVYDWTDLDLGHGFHETKQGPRYTVSPAARREILDRLLELNHARYAEEVRQGLHEKKRRNLKKGERMMKNKEVNSKMPFFD